MANRTDQIIESDDGFAPVTWILDGDRVKFIWHETAEVFNSDFWFESLCADRAIRSEWQAEITRRAGSDFFDVLCDVRDGLVGPDPSLVFLSLKETFARYGVNLDVEPHPWHGDVIARALELRAGRYTPKDGPVTFRIDQDRVVWRWTEIERHGTKSSFEDSLTEQEDDELAMRSDIEVRIAMSVAVKHLARFDDPSLVFLAVHEYFLDPGNGGVTFEFAPHPEHGDVLERARRIRDGLSTSD
jgi:hypothetical protein